MLKIRQSNFELLRLFAVFLVMAVHANYKVIGMPTYGDALTAPASTFVRILLEDGVLEDGVLEDGVLDLGR